MSERSRKLYERACRYMPGGVSRNTVLRQPHPLYAMRGAGCRVTDIEGTVRLDFANNMASLIHGHAHPYITEVVTRQLQRGTAFTLATEQEVEFAAFLVERVAAFDKLRFVNSGTEAVMSCLKAARAFTGRSQIAKAEGAYHGLYDYAEVSQMSNPSNWGDPENPASTPVARGTPPAALDDVVIIPFNDPERAVSILDKHQDKLACVLLDPLPHRVGMIPATTKFVRAIREWCTEHGALLIFDEVITFRTAHGGAQEHYECRADLTALGKMIGGGFPIGAIAGRDSVMGVMDPTVKPLLFPHSGTFSANPVSMVAGHAAMQMYDANAVDRLNMLGALVREQITVAIAVSGLPACVTGGGSMFRIHFKDKPPTDYRSNYASPVELQQRETLLDYLFDHGIMMINTASGTLSTAMTETEIDTLAETILAALRAVKESLPRAAAAGPEA
ncbi:aspartate aminotransferase family protein [bacterium]|nr:MAG: aspartate aminotransferase family protein [bacterium]